VKNKQEIRLHLGGEKQKKSTAYFQKVIKPSLTIKLTSAQGKVSLLTKAFRRWKKINYPWDPREA
jgi:hypothetical protein